MQMRAGHPAAGRRRRVREVQIGTSQPQRLTDPQPLEPQQHQQEAVPPRPRRLQQRLPLDLRRRLRPRRPPSPQPVPRSSPIAQPAALGTQLGRQVTIVGHLVKPGQHPAIHGPRHRRVLEELAHHRQHVIDPRRPRRPPPARARPCRRRRPQPQHEPGQLASAILQPSPGPPTPSQERGQVAGIHPRRRLRPITTEPEIEQELVSDRHRHVVVVDHRPIRPTVRQRHPKRPTARRLPTALANRGTLRHMGNGMTPTCHPRGLHNPKRDRRTQQSDC